MIRYKCNKISITSFFFLLIIYVNLLCCSVDSLLFRCSLAELFLLQILKILKHGSVRGLSVASFELELIGYTIALAYCIHKGLPFSAYGELAFLLIQGLSLT